MVRNFRERRHAWAILDEEAGRLVRIRSDITKDPPHAALFKSRNEVQNAIKRLPIVGLRPLKVSISYEVIA